MSALQEHGPRPSLEELSGICGTAQKSFCFCEVWREDRAAGKLEQLPRRSGEERRSAGRREDRVDDHRDALGQQSADGARVRRVAHHADLDRAHVLLLEERAHGIGDQRRVHRLETSRSAHRLHRQRGRHAQRVRAQRAYGLCVGEKSRASARVKPRQHQDGRRAHRRARSTRARYSARCSFPARSSGCHCTPRANWSDSSMASTIWSGATAQTRARPGSFTA